MARHRFPDQALTASLLGLSLHPTAPGLVLPSLDRTLLQRNMEGLDGQQLDRLVARREPSPR